MIGSVNFLCIDLFENEIAVKPLDGRGHEEKSGLVAYSGSVKLSAHERGQVSILFG